MKQSVLEVNYTYLADMLKRMSWKYVIRYGYDFDDVQQEACVALLLAHISYDQSKGTKFRTWVYQQVRGRLQTYHRKQMRRRMKMLEQQTKDGWNPFWLFEFLDSLGKDARTVVRIILDTPAELRYALKCRGKRDWRRAYDQHPKDVRMALREVLSDIGWTTRRVTKTFEEIRENLR